MTQWIDEVYLNGVLSGILLGLAGLWLLWVVNALWRSTLRPFAEGAPFPMRPSGWRARWMGEGIVDGRAVDVELRGGLRGPVAIIDQDDESRRVSLEGEDPDGWLERLS